MNTKAKHQSGVVRLPNGFLDKLRVVAAAKRMEMGRLIVQMAQGTLDRAYRAEIAKAQAEFDGGK